MPFSSLNSSALFWSLLSLTAVKSSSGVFTVTETMLLHFLESIYKVTGRFLRAGLFLKNVPGDEMMPTHHQWVNSALL